LEVGTTDIPAKKRVTRGVTVIVVVEFERKLVAEA
jgi:hypothetical protein